MTSVAAAQYLSVAASASLSDRFLIVSLHDVAPATWDATRKILADLQRRGVTACSLLVVPDYHHQGSVTEDAAFAGWLRDIESQGHEIVVHGYYHERPRPARESPWQRFVNQIYTQGEGEFFDLDYAEALRRITAGRDEFRALGLKPHGFIAPAWLLGAEAEQAARDAGMEYTTRLTRVRDLRSGKDFAARSLVYSVRNQWRRRTSLLWNGALREISRGNPLLRLSVHPVDYAHPTIWAQICRFLDELVPARTATTYRDWTSEWRMKGAPPG